MSGFPMPPPGAGSSSALLDRVKMFLPQMEKANAELERRIQQEGAAAVQIDSNLGAEGGDTEEQEEEQEEEEEQEDREAERSGSTGNSQALNTGVFASHSPPVTAAAASVKHDRGIANTTSIRNNGEKGKGEGKGGQTVQLEFVLGDVDATPIALAEAHAEQQILLEAAAEEELLRRQERGDEEELEEGGE